MQKKVTLSLDENIYLEFQEFCNENDLMLSKRVERLLKNHLQENGISSEKNISKKLNKKGGKK